MTTPRFRVFISGVSNEFESDRTAIYNDLAARGLEVKVQENFRQEKDSDTTLALLHNYIRDCDAVVCIVGRRSGSVPPAAAVEPFRAMLPAGMAEASYTQWELLFARAYKKRYSLYIASADHAPSRDLAAAGFDDADLQKAFAHYLTKTLGLNRGNFTTTDQLRVQVLREEWPDHRPRRIIHLPRPSIGTLFKGREKDMEAVRASLQRAAGAALGATAIVARGLGGVGKSRLAIEYAWRHAENYSAVLFVSGDTPEGLRQNIAELVGPLVLNLPGNETTTELEKRFEAALSWLNDNRNWFLIVDNLDTPEAAAAAEALLARLHGGHVLFTGRLKSFSATVEKLDLDVLAPQAAADFLVERTRNDRAKRPTDPADALQLAKELDGLALALEQAGAFIAEEKLSFAEYLTVWRSHDTAAQSWHNETLMHYPRSVAATWQTTMDRLGPGEIALLRLLSWFAPDPIPAFVLEGEKAEKIWREGIALYAEHSIQSATSSPPAAKLRSALAKIMRLFGRPKSSSPPVANLRSALVSLDKYSMITWNRDGEETVAVHRVVQEILRSRLPADQRVPWQTLSLRLLEEACPERGDDVRNWPRWNPLQPHVAYAVAEADAAGIAEPTTYLMGHLGVLYGAKAMHTEEELVKRLSLAIDEHRLGTEHPTVAIRLNNLAALLHATNRLSEAEPLMRRALAIDEQSFGKDHPNVAIRLNNLAALLHATNRLSEAEPLMRRALAIDKKSYGKDHPRVGRDLNNLAALLQDTNRLSEAEPLMRWALAIDEQSHGKDHPDVARDLNNLATLLQDTNRLSEAEPLMRRALAIDEQSYGKNHPKVAIRLNNLALLLRDTNRLSEAEPLMRRALDIDEKSYGAEHPEVATDLVNLAGLLCATERVTEAEPLMRRAASIYADSGRRNGYEHPHLQKTLGWYADILKSTGRTEAEVQAELAAVVAGGG